MTIRVSEGARLLAAAGSIEATAKATGFPVRSISGYRSGRRTPDGPHAAKLEAVLGVPVTAWGQAAREPEKREAAAPTSAAAAVSPGADEAHQASETQADHESATHRLRAQMARLKARREAGGLTPAAAAGLERLELAASVALGKLEGAELTMGQILASAHWARLKGVLLDALEPHPLALAAVENALLALEGRPPTSFLADVQSDHPEEVSAVRAASEVLLAAMIERRDRHRPAA